MAVASAETRFCCLYLSLDKTSMSFYIHLNRTTRTENLRVVDYFSGTGKEPEEALTLGLKLITAITTALCLEQRAFLF